MTILTAVLYSRNLVVKPHLLGSSLYPRRVGSLAVDSAMAESCSDPQKMAPDLKKVRHLQHFKIIELHYIVPNKLTSVILFDSQSVSVKVT